MKNVIKIFICAFFTSMILGCGGSDDLDTTQVFKSRGAIQCGSTGTPPELMQAELIQASIPVISLKCGLEPGFIPSSCGIGTAQINIFEIPVSQVDKAQALSFFLFETLQKPPHIPPFIGTEVPCPT